MNQSAFGHAGAGEWAFRAEPGKTAMVTGGASGIGLGISRALLERGLNVVMADIRDDHFATATAQLQAYGGRLMPCRLDVMNKELWREAVEAALARFGSVDVLCLNAGVGILGTILESTPADWQWIMGVNLEGVTNGIEAVLPVMRAQGAGGHIVATSSAGGLMVATDGGVYSAAKYGVVALMDCLRIELRSEGIGVTTLCPAGVNTNIHDHETMRPSEFDESGVRGDEATRAKRQDMARQMLAKGADPVDVGRSVLDAIDRNAPILFTDSAIMPIIEVRREAMLQATGSLPAVAAGASSE